MTRVLALSRALCSHPFSPPLLTRSPSVPLSPGAHSSLGPGLLPDSASSAASALPQDYLSPLPSGLSSRTHVCDAFLMRTRTWKEELIRRVAWSRSTQEERLKCQPRTRLYVKTELELTAATGPSQLVTSLIFVHDCSLGQTRESQIWSPN